MAHSYKEIVSYLIVTSSILNLYKNIFVPVSRYLLAYRDIFPFCCNVCVASTAERPPGFFFCTTVTFTVKVRCYTVFTVALFTVGVWRGSSCRVWYMQSSTERFSVSRCLTDWGMNLCLFKACDILRLFKSH